MDLFEHYCVLYERQGIVPQLTVVPLDNPEQYWTVKVIDTKNVGHGRYIHIYSSVTCIEVRQLAAIGWCGPHIYYKILN